MFYLYSEKQGKEDIKDLAVNSFQQAVADQHQEFMFNINGYQFSNEALDETIEEATKDVDAWADKNNISKEEAQLDVTFMIALKSATPEEREQMLQERAITHPESAKRIMQDATDNEQSLEQNNNQSQQVKQENPDTKTSADLTDKQQTAKIQLENDGFDEWDSPETESISTSVAKAVLPEDTKVANINSDFSQAADTTIADANIPAQDVTREYQNIMTV